MLMTELITGSKYFIAPKYAVNNTYMVTLIGGGSRCLRNNAWGAAGFFNNGQVTIEPGSKVYVTIGRGGWKTNASYLNNVGETTSFGTYLSANGAASDYLSDGSPMGSSTGQGEGWIQKYRKASHFGGGGGADGGVYGGGGGALRNNMAESGMVSAGNGGMYGGGGGGSVVSGNGNSSVFFNFAKPGNGGTYGGGGGVAAGRIVNCYDPYTSKAIRGIVVSGQYVDNAGIGGTYGGNGGGSSFKNTAFPGGVYWGISIYVNNYTNAKSDFYTNGATQQIPTSYLQTPNATYNAKLGKTNAENGTNTLGQDVFIDEVNNVYLNGNGAAGNDMVSGSTNYSLISGAGGGGYGGRGGNAVRRNIHDIPYGLANTYSSRVFQYATGEALSGGGGGGYGSNGGDARIFSSKFNYSTYPSYGPLTIGINSPFDAGGPGGGGYGGDGEYAMGYGGGGGGYGKVSKGYGGGGGGYYCPGSGGGGGIGIWGEDGTLLGTYGSGGGNYISSINAQNGVCVVQYYI